ncbi:MAG: universal stress protein [Deltaproteobacteria bacterium]|nr:universal stress protein [Deltaproteobacteria bacterium]
MWYLERNPADEIVSTAANENAHIIVIATHGLTGWRRLVFGSVSREGSQACSLVRGLSCWGSYSGKKGTVHVENNRDIQKRDY